MKKVKGIFKGVRKFFADIKKASRGSADFKWKLFEVLAISVTFMGIIFMTGVAQLPAVPRMIAQILLGIGANRMIHYSFSGILGTERKRGYLEGHLDGMMEGEQTAQKQLLPVMQQLQQQLNFYTKQGLSQTAQLDANPSKESILRKFLKGGEKE